MGAAKKKIDYRHLYFLFTDRDNCTYEDLRRFDSLKWKNKVVFVHQPLPDIRSAVYIPGFENEACVGMCINFRNRFTFKRYYDVFDYTAWFNNG